MKSFAAVLPCGVLASCSIAIDWPADMEPETYTGRVVRESAVTPVAGARVTIARPGKRFSKHGLGDWAAQFPAETIGTGMTGADGSFTVTTSGGYGTQASSGKGRLWGAIGSADQNHPDTKRLPETLVIPVDSVSVR